MLSESVILVRYIGFRGAAFLVVGQVESLIRGVWHGGGGGGRPGGGGGGQGWVGGGAHVAGVRTMRRRGAST